MNEAGTLKYRKFALERLVPYLVSVGGSATVATAAKALKTGVAVVSIAVNLYPHQFRQTGDCKRYPRFIHLRDLTREFEQTHKMAAEWRRLAAAVLAIQRKDRRP